jgi:hypothetical protein
VILDFLALRSSFTFIEGYFTNFKRVRLKKLGIRLSEVQNLYGEDGRLQRHGVQGLCMLAVHGDILRASYAAILGRFTSYFIIFPVWWV